MEFINAQPDYIRYMIYTFFALTVIAAYGFTAHFVKVNESKEKCRLAGIEWDESMAPKIYGLDIMKKFFKGLGWFMLVIITTVLLMMVIGVM